MEKTENHKPRELGLRPSSPVSKEAVPSKTFREKVRQTREWQWLMSLEQQHYAGAQLALVR